MKRATRSRLMNVAVVLSGAFVLSITPGIQRSALAQDYSAPPSFSPRQLDSLVSRIALYPDPLLAQVLAAASFPDQIPEAARWADQYKNLHGDELADAIYQSNLQFDPAVQALIPFPAVLDMMARDMNWTSQLGEAALADQRDVMDAVQRMRRTADEYGYLQNNQQMRVVNSGYGIEIEPADPSLIYVPVYDPYVVYAPPRPGFFIAGAIGFGPRYSIGAFRSWGWGGGFNWNNHSVFVNRAVWGRNWNNRTAYVHNYGNWDRGAWRDTYANRYANRNVTVYNNRTVYQNENVNRYSNAYSNGGRDYRGVQRNAEQAPVMQNRNYDRTYDRNGFRGGQSAPVAAPTVNTYQQNTNTYQQNPGNYQQNPGRDAYRNSYGNPGAYRRGGQAAPVATPAPEVNTSPIVGDASRENSYRDRYRNSNNNPGMYRGGQAAPVAPAAPAQNRTFERNTYANPANNSAPAQSVQQGRGFADVRGTAQGRMEHNGGGRR